MLAGEIIMLLSFLSFIVVYLLLLHFIPVLYKLVTTPVIHYANHHVTACNRALVTGGGTLPLHTTLKEKVTCQKCKKHL